ncbi:MAG: hypothetical protein R3191_03415, partial [Anaerolineales bacterium]|nr:hypothetical protein [Anaerolineales bacterium]
MRKSRGLLAAGTVLVFLFASGFLCTLVDTAQEEDPDRSAQPATLIPAGGADSPGTIKAGEEAEGEGGVIIGASDDALDAPLNVWIEPADEPTDATDFPPEAKRETPYFRIGAAENIYARQNGWFRVEIPVSDQANTGHLALVVLEPAGSVIYDGNCESEECDDFTRYDAWLDLEGIYDPETSRFITSLPFLSSEGRIVTVISSEDYESLTPEEHEQRNAARDIGGALLRPANSGLMFIARCRRFIWHAGRSCGDAEKNMATADLSDVFSDLTGIGYKEAELRHVFLYPRHYVVYLRPLVNSTDGDDDPELCEIEDDGDRITGQYSPGTNKMTICIDTDGYSDNETATLRHEYFHATQWAYDGVTNDPDWSGWVIEGTATASEFSLNTMDRDDGRSLHTIDRPLRSDAGFFEYRAQDFWVYLGDRFGEDLGYLEALFER